MLSIFKTNAASNALFRNVLKERPKNKKFQISFSVLVRLENLIGTEHGSDFNNFARKHFTEGDKWVIRISLDLYYGETGLNACVFFNLLGNNAPT